MTVALTSASLVDQLPLAAGVICGRFVYANRALVELLGYGEGRIAELEADAIIAPEHRDRFRRHCSGGEPLAGNPGCELDVVRADGERRRVSLHVASAGAHTLIQLVDRTASAEHARKLVDLARLGASLQTEHTRDRLLAKLERGGAALGLVMLRLDPNGDRIVVRRFGAPTAPGAEVDEPLGAPGIGLDRPWTPGAIEAAWRDGIAFIDDLCPQLPAAVDDLPRAAGHRRAVLLRIDEADAPSHVLALSASWLEPDDVPALTLFGDQVTAALAAVKAISDLSQRNEELAALNRLAMSVGTVTDSTVLFERGCTTLAELFAAIDVVFYLVRREDGVAVRAHAHGRSVNLPGVEAPIPLEGTRIGDVAREGKPRVFHLEDFATSQSRHMLKDLPYQAIAAVPLIARGEVIGVMNLAFVDRRQLEPRELAFLEAAAAHFAAVLEANRLVEDLRRSYVELSRTQAQLVANERLAALGEMAAAVAHEVRNPLGVIFNSVGSLRRLVDGDSKDSDMLIEIIAEEAARLASAADRIELEIVSADDVPAVRFDGRLLRQALLNLALNAVQSIDGRGTLRIRVSAIELDGRAHARLEVRDDGPGIPCDVLPRVFEPFFTTRPTGTGLGLALVKRIVEGHHGRISVSSACGKSTAFVIDLPADGAAPDGAPGISVQ